MLEIGTWFGLGSTQLWFELLPNGSEIVLLDKWTAYSSPADQGDPEWNYVDMDSQTDEAFLSAYYQVKYAESSGRDLQVSLLRGDSTRLLPLMRSNQFDLVFIDGDHKYSVVQSDITQALRLLRSPGGILVGDDLEYMPNEELLSLARGNLDRDYVRSPHRFHPGVMVAVAELIPDVHMENGVWWYSTANGEDSPT